MAQFRLGLNIPHPPDCLAIEIVSAKYGLKNDLKKMETIWIKTRVNVGLVICPFTEKIYIFENGKSCYTTQIIHENFSHLLSGYSDNFRKYLKKKK